jgi:hypothetical protein
MSLPSHDSSKSEFLSLRVIVDLTCKINILSLCSRRQKESLENLESFHVKREFHAADWC